MQKEARFPSSHHISFINYLDGMLSLIFVCTLLHSALMSTSYHVKKNPDKLLAKPSHIDVDSMQLLLFAWSAGAVRSYRWSKWQILENPKHDQFLLFSTRSLQVQRLLREKYSRWRFSAKSALLEECPDKMTVFPADDRSKAIIFAFYHLRFVLLKSSALFLCLLLFIKAKPLILLAVICWTHVTNKSSNRPFFLQSRAFLHELVAFYSTSIRKPAESVLMGFMV